MLSIYLQCVSVYASWCMTVQIEIAVVCHIEGSCLICLCIIYNSESIFFCYLKCHINDCISREALLQICILYLKGNLICLLLLNSPEALRKTIWTTVKTVLIVISLKLIFHSININLCIKNPVCISADSSTKIAVLLLIWLYIVIS